MTHPQLKNSVRVRNRILRRSRWVIRSYLSTIGGRHRVSLYPLSTAKQAAAHQVKSKIAAIGTPTTRHQFAQDQIFSFIQDSQRVVDGSRIKKPLRNFGDGS